MNENQKPSQINPEGYEGYTGPPVDLKKTTKIELNLGQLFLGLILIFGGMLYLAKNMGWLNFELNFSWVRYWPILLVFAGLAMIKTRSLVTTILGLIAVLLTFAIVVWVIFGTGLWGLGS
jgi:uncharacterized membrane protein (UPF0136 family)